MAEMDVFKRRLADTLAWYADEVQPTVDAPVVARRVALEHPRRRANAVSWRVATPPRAWVLLLVAALLAALAGGALIVGSQPQPRLPGVVPPVPAVVPPARVVPPAMPAFVCPPGSTPDEPGPADQARPLGPSTMAFDRKAGKLVAFADTVDGVETWTFDVCTNTWTQMHPDRAPSFGTGFRLVYDDDSDLTIGFASQLDEGPNVWVYDLNTDTWTEKSRARTAAGYAVIPQAVYDPVTGLVITWDRAGELWAYDVEADRWTRIHQANRPTIDSWRAALAYDASVDRMIACTGDETWQFDLRTSTWSRSSAVTPYAHKSIVMSWLAPEIAYDEAARRTVISGFDRMATYDATADRWESLFAMPFPYSNTTLLWRQDLWRKERFPRWMAYDPVNERLVAPGELESLDDTQATAYDVLGLDPLTREWTVLLEPSRRSGHR